MDVFNYIENLESTEQDAFKNSYDLGYDLGKEFGEKMIECNFQNRCVMQELDNLLNDACHDYEEYELESFEQCFASFSYMFIKLYESQKELLEI